jgi:hypothetical protein
VSVSISWSRRPAPRRPPTVNSNSKFLGMFEQTCSVGALGEGRSSFEALKFYTLPNAKQSPRRKVKKLASSFDPGDQADRLWLCSVPVFWFYLVNIVQPLTN